MKKEIISREECKEIQLNILKEITNICKINGINYSLTYGTLIGAIRHKGYIPWDDDIDICVMRCDYEKLLSLLRNQSKCSFLSIIDNNVKGYYYPFAKAVDNRTVAEMSDNITTHGIWVDIFPIDSVPNNHLIQKLFLTKMIVYRSFLIAMTTNFNGHKKNYKYYAKLVLTIIGGIIGKEKIAKRYQKSMQSFNNQQTDFVGCLSSAYIKKECFPRNWFESYDYVRFEDSSFLAITAYNRYLTELYGEYMKLPPIQRRTCHSIKAWRIDK